MGLEATPHSNVTNERLSLMELLAVVRSDHRAIRGLLDEVEQAAALADGDRGSSLDRLHKAVWDLYVRIDQHLFLEERDLAPVLVALHPSGADVSSQMMLEHNEQRAALLELVEDSESDIRPAEELTAEALAFAVRFRTDMLIEEAHLSAVASNEGLGGALRIEPYRVPVRASRGS